MITPSSRPVFVVELVQDGDVRSAGRTARTHHERQKLQSMAEIERCISPSDMPPFLTQNQENRLRTGILAR